LSKPSCQTRLPFDELRANGTESQNAATRPCF